MSRWDAFTFEELHQIRWRDLDDPLLAEIEGEYERRIESKAGACPPEDPFSGPAIPSQAMDTFAGECLTPLTRNEHAKVQAQRHYGERGTVDP